ncbi:MAG: Mannan endo,4-beta-mannosidase [Pseudomonadota bacterium]
MKLSRSPLHRVLVSACLVTSSCSAGVVDNSEPTSPSQLGPQAGAPGATGVAGVTPVAGAAGRTAAAGSGGAGSTAAGSGGRANPVPGSGGRSGAGTSGGAGAGGASGAVAGAAGKPSMSGPHDTYYVQDGTLYDACGEAVVLRGINHPTLYVDRDGKAMPEIAKTGANSVRLFWYATRNVAIGAAETAIKAALDNHMLPILEMHDSTCEWSLDKIVDYWTSAEALALIERHKAHLIINIANEPSAPNDAAFKTTYTSVVNTLRSAGIHVPLMIDGSNCGRDYDVLLSQGPALLAADPDHNLIFSGHLYDRLSADRLAGVYTSFKDAKLTFVVGEFANKSPPGCGAMLDYAALIGEAQKHATGWLAWSWGDDDANSIWNSDCAEFDMTSTFAFDSLQSWGKEVAVTLPDSITNTAKRPASLTTGQCR